MTDDQRTHPSTDDLADLDAGLLDPATAHDVRAHLAACASCADESAAFLAVRSVLAGEPDPGPVPPDVAARLDAALAAIATERGLGGAAVPGVETSGAPPEERLPRHRRLLPGVLAAAAAVGVVGLGAWAALGGLAGGDEPTAGGSDSAAQLSSTDSPAAATRSAESGAADESPAEEAAPPQEDAAGVLEAPEAAEAAPGPVSPEEDQQRLTDLTAAVVDGSAPPDREAPGCGDAFAEAYGSGLLAAVPTTYDGAEVVMLVVPGPGFGVHTGYVVPTCDSLPGDELATVEVAP